MEDVPAMCIRCGHIFPSGVVADSASSITVVGPDFLIPTTTSCPRCKGPGQFELPIKETISTILEQRRTNVDLELFLDVVSDAIKKRMDHNETVESIESKAPVFKEVAKRVPPDRMQRYAYLAMIAAFLQVIVTVAPKTLLFDDSGIYVLGANVTEVFTLY